MKTATPKPSDPPMHGGEPSRRLQVVRDPRDLRELATDILGLPLDASIRDVAEAPRPRSGDADVLSRRKREQAWLRFRDPVQRLAEEALLYPMEPLPDPDDDGFPSYDPALPPLPELHSTEMAFSKLLDAVEAALEPPVEPPEPELRLGHEPEDIRLPPPPLPKRWD